MALICVAQDIFVEVDDADWAEVVNLTPNWHLSDWGYARTKYKGHDFYLHKVIYNLVDPTYVGLVDHIDQNPLNCKRNNLRSATSAQNRANGSVRSDNTSGVPGVSECKITNRWRVRVNSNGEKVFDESFDTIEEAIAIRQEMYKKYHGDFRKE